ncbi:hypothetical protein SAMN05444146_3537 [Flavobacterium johnsoniae]|uniref:DUF304 domain-containing protein n=2 Tax=Flavobacterium johnsoniae TaxID=986 RepID=A5FCS4_FLAJ1|nr:hypothetical protein Fjoh_3979 [Flavobacterium johnsoniae UW101]OXE98713.1 hypothetical protein B0A63_13760 [Flavobacterium johnsoniae UW101]SHL34046.1 hypothetical protein SAMN05444146_3537 [Flavobacterium johnsoniae]
MTMTHLKYFEKNGSQYTLKREYGFGIIVSVGMAAFAAAGLWLHEAVMFWIFDILAVLCFISIWMKQVSIDMDKKEITAKIGIINPPVRIPLQDFQNFELVRIRQYMLTTNTSLNAYYLKDGKEKCVMIAQAFTSRKIQNLANEIDEILNSNEHS